MKKENSSPLKRLLFFITFWGIYNLSFAQSADSLKVIDSLKHKTLITATVSVTNNGFSYIPSFTLEKPAVIGFVTIERKRLIVNSELAYAYDGQPWILFIEPLYKIINKAKFQVAAGMQFPSVAFSKISVFQDGDTKNILQAQQSFAPELNTNYRVSKNISIGTNYLYNRGLGNTFPKKGHFFAVQSAINNIKLPKSFSLALSPQVFYLYIDHFHGFYTAANIILSKKKMPFTISSMMYKTVSSNVGGKGFDWSISLNYSFSNN